MRQVVQAIGQLVALGIFDIGLVQHHQHLRRHPGEETLQGVRTEPGPGRVVRVGDEHYASLPIDGGEHRLQVMPPGARLDRPPLGAHGLGGDRVDGEGMFAEHGVQTRREVGTGDQVENVVGAVAQGHLRRIHRATLGQLALEFETVAVRITGQFRQFGADCLQRLWARTQRILVAGELDDRRRVEAQLAGQFVHRLARDVGRQLLHPRLGQGKEIGHG